MPFLILLQIAIGSNWNGSIRVELDEDLHPPLLEVTLVERGLAQLAHLVQLVEQEGVALVDAAAACSDAGAATEGGLQN